jgi:ketosteroid isomerase-like protein
MIAQPDTAIYAAVKRYADCWAAGDLRAIIDCYHDDVIFHYFGQSPLAGTHRGKPACLEVLKKVRERTNRKLVSIKDVLFGQHYGLVVAVETFERNGTATEVERLLRYTVRDGKLSECWVYDEDQQLIDKHWSASDA